MLRLTSLSFAHPMVPVSQRARLALPGPLLQRAHERLQSQGLEAFLLSTCLRVEIAWSGDEARAADLLDCLYGDGSPSNLAELRTDEAAFTHLSRVAAGLNSPLVGEPEVLGQFRQAATVWREASTAPAELGKALEAAIRVGRSARRRMGDTPRGSLATLAADAVASLGRVAIIGSGAMARAAAEHLGDVELTVFARSPAQVAGRTSRPWVQAPEALATYPAVISAVPGKVPPLFEDGVIARAIERRTEPLLLIDLGVPPVFDRPETDGLIRVVGVDDLAASVSTRVPAEAEQRLLEEAAAAWARLSVPNRAGTVIAAILEQADEAVGEEVHRFAGRLAQAENPERVLQQLAHTVARRVLHPPISFIGSSDNDQGLQVVAEAFGVGDE